MPQKKLFLKLVPSRKQWSTWSLPSKLSVVGSYIGALSFLFAIAVFIFGTQNISRVIDVTSVSNLKNGELNTGAVNFREEIGVRHNKPRSIKNLLWFDLIWPKNIETAKDCEFLGGSTPEGHLFSVAKSSCNFVVFKIDEDQFSVDQHGYKIMQAFSNIPFPKMSFKYSGGQVHTTGLVHLEKAFYTGFVEWWEAKRNSQLSIIHKQQEYQRSKQSIMGFKGMICASFRASTSTCKVNLSKPSIVKQISIGHEESELNLSIIPNNPNDSIGVAYSNERRNSYLIPIDIHSLRAKIEFDDGSSSPIYKYQQRTGSIAESYQFIMNSSDKEAPMLLAYTYSAGRNDDAGWGFVPIVGDEVNSISWSHYRGGDNEISKLGGFYSLNMLEAGSLGVKDWLEGDGGEPVVSVKYTYGKDEVRKYDYTGLWREWILLEKIGQIDYKKAIDCTKDVFRFDSNLKGDYTICDMGYLIKSKSALSEILWGVTPENLVPVAKPDGKAVLESHVKAWISEINTEILDIGADGTRLSSLTRQRDRLLNGDHRITLSVKHSLDNKLKHWKDVTNHLEFFFILQEIRSALYFKFKFKNNTESPVFKVPVN